MHYNQATNCMYQYKSPSQAVIYISAWCIVHAGTVMGDLHRRRGVIHDSWAQGDDTIIQAQVPLNLMFGYSTSLRSNTQVGRTTY